MKVLRNAVVALLLAASPALAHMEYERLVNPRGEPCCGSNDCAPYEETWSPAADGIHLHDGTIVPWDRVMQSFDDKAHRCIWGGETKCFLIPVSM